uniref:Uncharacterized protein n=1 Tax=Megaselia scalaris TaxID=36166 RepID=T1H587_MEGSC
MLKHFLKLIGFFKPNGLVCIILFLGTLCSNNAYHSSVHCGEVQIFDAINLHAKTMILVHNLHWPLLHLVHRGQN